MRLWSLHPRYLDTVGLTACWREALLAQKVLAGATHGYRHHPQLERFRDGSALADGASTAADGAAAAADAKTGHAADGAADAKTGHAADAKTGHAADAAVTAGRAGWPGDLIVAYLHALADEADARGHRFDRNLIVGVRPPSSPVEVTDGQLAHEWAALRAKLAARSPEVLARWGDVVVPDAHPCFVVVSGPVADWEAVSPRR